MLRGFARGAPASCIVAAVFIVPLAGAWSQQASPRLGEPAQIEERLPRAPATPADAPPPRALAPAPTEAAGARFVLAGVLIEGATRIAPAEFAPLYAPLLGVEIGPAEIGSLVEAITSRYREAGYVLSRAVAPPQDAALGLLRIDILEGYVERVTLEGEAAGALGALQSYAEGIRRERPLTLATLERGLLLMGDLPGIRLSSGVAPLDPLSPAHELIIQVERDSAEAFVGIDNRGTRAVGRDVAQGVVRLNSPLGLDESTTLRTFTVPSAPRELLFLQLREQVPIGGDGASLAVDIWRSEIEAGGRLEDLDVDSMDKRAALDVVYPWLRSRSASLYLTGQLEYRDSSQDVLGASFFEDRIRSVRVGARLLFEDAWGGSSFIAVVGSHGLDVAGASERGDPLLSRSDGDPAYAKLTLDLSRRQRLFGPLALQAWLGGQLASGRMLSGEEFRLGGGVFARAYDPSELVGDEGLAGALEAQWDLPSPGAALSDVQAYGFWDLGAVWNDVAGAGADRDSLASAGLGLRTILFDDVSAYLEAAKPLTREIAESGDHGWRLFVSVGFAF